MGLEKTHSAIKFRYAWPDMYKDIRKMYSACEKCQLFNVAHRKKSGPMKPIVTPQEPFVAINLDFAGPYIE